MSPSRLHLTPSASNGREVLSKSMTEPETRRLTAEDVANIQGSMNLEGCSPTPELDADLAKVVAGEMTMQEMRERADGRLETWKVTPTVTPETSAF